MTVKPSSKTPLAPPGGARIKRSAAEDSQLLVGAFALLSPVWLGIAVGLLTGAGLFLLTAVLLVKAALWGAPGQPVGPHLALLSNYLPGYQVSWLGAFLGLIYGFIGGFLFGVALSAIVNLQHVVFVRRIERRSRREAMFDGL